MKCYYEILEVSRGADDSEIKSAYRKLALKWHPDKNIDNTEYAKEQFQFVQQAYEVLSDRQERAWYDNHREQILRGSDSNYQDNSLDVFPYFTRQCFSGYGDDEKGFYAVYRKVFEQLAKDEIEYLDSKSDYDDIPGFGYSSSDYNEIVAPFYAYWSNFCTRKSYVWLDPYSLNETRERRVLKLIEKENKKVRQKAKKERNEEIRNLVAFVRKRDKRVQEHAKLLELKNAENKKKYEEMRNQRLLKRREKISNHAQPQAEWTKFDNVKLELKEIEKNLAEQFGEELSDSEHSDDERQDLYCPACNKIFKNPNAFANHESSKKHRENVEKLKILLLEEEQEMHGNLDDEDSESEFLNGDEKEVEVNDEATEQLLDDENKKLSDSDEGTSESSKNKNVNEINNEDELSDSDEVVNQSSKKKNKKNKKVIKIRHHSEEEDLLSKEAEALFDKSEVVSDDDFDFGTSKKQKRKSRAKPAPNNTSQNKTNEEIGNSQNMAENVTSNKNNNKKSKVNKKNCVDAAENIDVAHCCVTCKSNFSSKNKLFEHLKKTGHSVMLPQKATKIKKK